MIASVECSVRGYFGEESPEFDEVCRRVTTRMRELREAPCVPMRFNNLNVVIYNWEIDSANPIHKILLACHAKVSGDLKERIEGLFEEPIR